MLCWVGEVAAFFQLYARSSRVIGLFGVAWPHSLE